MIVDNKSYFDYLAIVRNQGDKCASCGRKHKILYMDYDRQTNRIRGLLCRRCNTGIGMLGDTIEGVQKAVTYLGKRETDIEFHSLGGIPPASKNVVCIDFDGTLYPRGELFGYPPPLKGAKEFVNFIYNKGFYVVIWTSRLSEQWFKDEGWDLETAHKEQVNYISSLLQRDGIPYHKITSEKIPALAYLDDRAIKVENNWDDIIKEWRNVSAE